MTGPRIEAVPEYDRSLGDEAIEFGESIGVKLDGWQKLVVRAMLGRRKVRKRERYAALESALVVPRQNGKSEVLLLLALYAAFEHGEELVMLSAHQWTTTRELFRRLIDLVSGEALAPRVGKVTFANADEQVKLTTGERIKLGSRARGGGRGLSADFLVLDEAHTLPETAHASIVPTLSARPDPHIVYCGSPVDELSMPDGVVLARLRERGLRGDDPRLVYLEWSAQVLDADGRELGPERIPPEVASDPQVWARANPALGIRIAEEYVAGEYVALDPRSFACERLGVGAWPNTDGTAASPIDVEAWLALVDPESSPVAPVVLGVDVSPDRRASIAVAGRRTDGLLHVEVVDRRDGTGWLPRRVADLVARHNPAAVVADAHGPIGGLIAGIEELAGVEVVKPTVAEVGYACATLVDAVREGTLRHLGGGDLLTGIKSASTRPLGDAWTWRRRNSACDISPLVASTLALWRAAELNGVPLRIY